MQNHGIQDPALMSYQLLSSSRWDPYLLSLRWNCTPDDSQPSPFLLLQYHVDRLIDAAGKHDWPVAKSSVTLDALRDSCKLAVERAHSEASEPPRSLKLRITVDRDGKIATTTSPLPPLASDPLSASFFNPSTDSSFLFSPVQAIILDTEPTPTSVFTITKSTQREVYDTARERAGLLHYNEPKDVLLHNAEQQITETSIHNVALWRKRRYGWHWITPHHSSGCLPGVIRRWLLEQDRIREASPQDDLSLTSVQPGDWILLFNGVKGCQLGRVKAL